MHSGEVFHSDDSGSKETCVVRGDPAVQKVLQSAAKKGISGWLCDLLLASGQDRRSGYMHRPCTVAIAHPFELITRPRLRKEWAPLTAPDLTCAQWPRDGRGTFSRSQTRARKLEDTSQRFATIVIGSAQTSSCSFSRVTVIAAEFTATSDEGTLRRAGRTWAN